MQYIINQQASDLISRISDYDIDNDGMLNFDEFKLALSEVNTENLYTNFAVRHFKHEVFNENKTKIGFQEMVDEYIEFYTSLYYDEEVEKKKVFRNHDPNQDGGQDPNQEYVNNEQDNQQERKNIQEDYQFINNDL